MTLLWQIFRKDARRLRLPLALWSILIVAQHSLEWRALLAGPEEQALANLLGGFALVCFALKLGVTYILAAALVLEDSPADSRAFWLTRPVSGVRMLGAKVIGSCLLLVVPPTLISVPWSAATGVGAAPMLSSFGGVVAWQAWMATAGLVVATLSRTSGQFLAWSVGLQLAGLAVLIAVFSPQDNWSKALAANGPGFFAWMTAAGCLTICGLAATLLAQYQARRPRFALAIFGITLAGVVVLVRCALG